MISGLMTLIAGVIGFLLVLTLIDHWVIALSWWGRWLALVALLAGAGCYVALQIVPLMLRPINPVYAAKAIEEAEPSLKNSLINFLLFRQDRQAVHQVVYSALEQRAATDLSHVPIENAVDRSKVIYIGYVLAGMLALGAAYKILSPKDPFQSVSRVATPWADIERPSRVQIHEVIPGDAEVFQGESVAISAAVVGNVDVVELLYSTADGEIVDRAIEMKVDSSGLRYECVLPESGNGLQRPLSYRIEAGDARTSTYRLRVSPAPNIVVDRLEYEFPRYTNLSVETLRGQGDIKALEGTRVTIHAKANQPIRAAFVELDPDSDESTRLPMEFNGQAASRVIVLELGEDRRTPLQSSYQLSFTTESERENKQPILHRIEVIPDLTPEVEILTPAKEVTELPADGVQEIEIRALDPDFRLRRLTLRAVSGGDVLVDEDLFDDQNGAEGQTVRTLKFRPEDYDLQVGARVTFRATAEDNRTAIGSNSPEPNTARTRDYQLVIVPPLKSDEPAKSSADPKDDPTADPDQESSRSETEPPSKGEPQEKEPSEEGGSEGEEGDTERGEGQEGEQQQSGAGGEGEESTGGEQQEGAGGQGKQQEGGTGEQSGSENPQGGQTQGGKPGEGAKKQGGQPGQSGTTGERTEEPHDGEVFEKALERIKRKHEDSGKQGEGEASSGDPQQEPLGSGEDSASSSGNTGSSKGGSDQQPDEGTANNKLPDGDEQLSSQQESDPQQPGEGSKHEDNDLGAGAQKQATPGEGGTSKKDGEPTGRTGAEPDRGEKEDPQGSKDMRKKDPGAGDSGDSGAGQNSEETEGSGAVEGEQTQNKDRPKKQNSDSSGQQQKEDSAASADKKQSDSKGEGSGDRSGGGKKGAGQGANQTGNDSPGQNSAADEGAGKATESGEGETSDAPGQKQESDGPTGSEGTQKGEGSASRQDPEGDTSATRTQQPQAQSDDSNKQQSEESDSNKSKGGPKQGGDGVSTGGGLPSNSDRSPGLDKDAEVLPGDEANLEYARRTTDMVLDYLKDQKDDPDTELLDELGWTKRELNDFLKRWQQLKQAASEDDVSKRELDESLRSLGLRPARDRSRTGGTKSDDVRGLRDSGSQSTAPAGYQKLIDAFKKGAARSSK